MPVAWNITQTMLTSFANIPGGDVLSGKVYRTSTRTAKTGDGFHQFILAIPGDPSNSQDLAGPNVETNIPDNFLSSV